MTVAYPLTRQSDYTELMYSLRSIEKYLFPPFEVIIIGDYAPDWLTNVTHIELEDIKGRPQLSVRSKVFAALEYTDEILFMNDDIYLLQQAFFPYWFHNGDLKSNGMSGSKKLLTELKAMGKPTKSFELHYPMIYKNDFKEVMQNFSGDCLHRSAYCNYLGIEGVSIPDCKIIKPVKEKEIRNFIKDRTCFSTGVHSFLSSKPILQELFPVKSKYEI